MSPASVLTPYHSRSKQKLRLLSVVQLASTEKPTRWW